MHACFSLGTVLGAGIGALAAWLAVPVVWHLLGVAVAIVVVAVIAIRYIPREADLGDEAVAAPKVPFGQRMRESLGVKPRLRIDERGERIAGVFVRVGGHRRQRFQLANRTEPAGNSAAMPRVPSIDRGGKLIRQQQGRRERHFSGRIHRLRHPC